ncbi:hypothetical protein J3R83DRAFT_5434 [Lanmaoa asiatica]|nr:hypothetical protein J3R83DRAFT_5434 [Lanmaoa asiatica]
MEGQDLESAMLHALTNLNKLGRHSAVYIFLWSGDRLLTTRYVWAHHDYCPWGMVLPVQCPECGTPQQWKQNYVHRTDESMYKFNCCYKDCRKDLVTGLASCRGQIIVYKPEGVWPISLGKTKCSGWLSEVIS